jgi:hypothetical protein
MRRIPLVEHAKYHDHQQNGILNKINQNAPLELVCAADATGTQSRDPLGLTLIKQYVSAPLRYMEGKEGIRPL